MTPATKSGLLALVLALSLGACGAPGPNNAYAASGYSATPYGTVESVDIVADAPSRTTGAGAVLGGVAGGVLGHQIGSGRGNDAATVAGAVGGAVVGNEVEKRHNEREGATGRYRVAVHMDDGSYQTFLQDYADVRPGDRVRVDNGRVTRY
jgi:outer membrane lipoprotein SlyB